MLSGKATENDTSRILKAYLDRRDKGASFDILGNDADIVAAFAWRTAHLTFEALKYRDVEKRSWNDLLVTFWRLSTALSQYLVVKNFYEAVTDPSLPSLTKNNHQDNGKDKDILRSLFRLHALHTLDREASEFFSSAAVTVRQIGLAQSSEVTKLLNEIRPHAVALVDAWKIPDWQLDSSLGRYDGDVYRDLFGRASTQNPVNGLVFEPSPWSQNVLKGEVKSKL